jgi:hypothetical protein
VLQAETQQQLAQSTAIAQQLHGKVGSQSALSVWWHPGRRW